MDLKTLIKKAADLRAAGKTKLAALNALLAVTEPTDEQKAQITALEAEVDAVETDLNAVNTDIAKKEAAQRRQALFAAPSSIIIGERARFTSNEPDPVARGGFQSMAHFATTVRDFCRPGGGATQGLGAAPATYMQNAGAAGEGFLVPPEFRQAIWDLVFGGYDLLSMFSPTPTASNSVQFAKDETTPWGSSGVQAYWRAEAAQLTPSRLALTGVGVPLHEVYAFVQATDEVLADAPLLQDRLTVKAAAAINYKISDAIMFGDGVGKPFGYFNSPAKIAQAKDTGQTAATITVTNLTNMRTRLMPDSLNRSMWVGNSEIEPQLVNLSIGNFPVFMPWNTGLRDAPGAMLMGRPLQYIWQAYTLGTEGDLMLFDPTGYFLLTKEGGGIDFAASIHLFFDYNVSAFRWIFRVGGQPVLSAVVSPPTGRSTVTRSHFVSLATRS
jgi:HK97 family phage major capsid protein